jgi:hypothetical protein
MTPIRDTPTTSRSVIDERGCLIAAFTFLTMDEPGHCTHDGSVVELRPDRTRLERPPQTV